ncbi:MAG: haloacid dehalogenase-like hydrolase [Gemmatimonadetes bacterium]|nr:haloacid dehalogenase-like hydrolase [Gemmatimonadota bacterium]
MKLVLFDIDGTLLWTDGAGRSAIRTALLAEMGATGPIEGFRFDGKTDPQIVHELLRAFGNPHAESGAHVQAVCDRYVEMLEGELASGKRTPHVFPGVWELLDLIERRDDAVLGLLTGNLAAGARLKLASVGMEFDRFRVGAFGSDAAERGELPAIAAARAAELVGEAPTGEDIVIIGDTPADVTCGLGVGARAIAVATGSYGVAELAAAGAYAVFEDLLDTEGVLEAILGD